MEGSTSRLQWGTGISPPLGREIDDTAGPIHASDLGLNTFSLHAAIGLFLDFFGILCMLFNNASSAAPQISLCRWMLRSDLGLLRLWHWQPDAVTTRLDLIHTSAFLYKIKQGYARDPLLQYSFVDLDWPALDATPYQKSDLCIELKLQACVRPRSQFLHSCICELFLYSQDWSASIWLQQKRQTDPGNI